MTVEEIKRYFDSYFFVERLTSDANNRERIKSFEAPGQGENLERYLHEKAWTDDKEGETKVYLIKDKNDFLVAFFSFKCGLLYDSHEYEKLTGDELEFVNLVVEQLEMDLPEKGEILQQYYECYEQIPCERKDKLMGIAYQRFDELQDLMVIKPDYDRGCQAMVQEVAEIERDERTFWARYRK